MRTTDADRFAAYYAARYRALPRTAYLLCGDWHEAEDLTQAAFVRLYLAWGRIRVDGAHAYARRVLVNEFLGRRRRTPRAPGGDGAGPARDRRPARRTTGWTCPPRCARCRPSSGRWWCWTGTLEELTAIVTDPGALRYLPRP
jgi:DNA-directed RNA polymerase specialized sigma24 family protein